MNIFRFLGDVSHMLSIGILLYSIEVNRSVDGLSLKTQALYVAVFVIRYVDLLYKFVSLYNSFMKLFFIATSVYTVYLMTHKYPKKIREDTDTFPVKYLGLAAGALCLIFTHAYTLREITWSFSIWLEALAILPQLFMLQKTGSAENITTHYIFALGVYRFLYIPNWLYRYFAEGKFDYVAVLAGISQTLIYSDFFYIYYTKVMQGKTFELPV
ncbi:ER lumen protein retaining receptor [Metschnikowia bicuspidata var. bicuspidata NRRL YB-4993]|uniref:ER lumen protein retaining receptor n=1 Tax=Metschnikowia bicuspidata var. bicuspidata NRRL YB-4993 TaxID=869754 RepID=A0A1A0HDS4_9ASCO|nr:ER lumen protein retaining receptor [Metschnikowia bicuspidata var. bicuspidata NRRL YB-4993]OBA22239.1 ER lumen protein retaining receptor [Metschnikowia bicuspidata var. bicuspidata NRRL YB-4993]